jgi:hypothetical protein
MKFALLSLFAVLSLSACKKTTVVNQTVDQAYSVLFTINPADWVQGQDGAQTFYSVNLSIPELDDVINTHGGVEVYISFDGGANYETVPEVYNGVAYGSLHTTGQVTIDLRDANGGSLTSAISAPLTAKIVLIDATPLDN